MQTMFDMESKACPFCQRESRYPVVETEEAWWQVCHEHGVRWAVARWDPPYPQEHVERERKRTWAELERFVEICGRCEVVRDPPLQGLRCPECGEPICPACGALYDPVRQLLESESPLGIA